MLSKEEVQRYQEDGLLIVKNVLDKDEIDLLKSGCKELCNKANILEHDDYFGTTFVQLQRAFNPFDNLDKDAAPIKGHLRRVTYPYSTSSTFDEFRTHENILKALEQLLGPNIVQIVNQVNFNNPGVGKGWGWHQDYRFRKEGMTNFPFCYVQSLIAIDEVTGENGGLKLVRGSHKLGQLKLDVEQDTAESQFDANQIITPELQPGDMALFSPYTIHGSSPNHSKKERRVFINGYANTNNCNYGVPVMENGTIIKEATGCMEYENQKDLLPLASKRH